MMRWQIIEALDGDRRKYQTNIVSNNHVHTNPVEFMYNMIPDGEYTFLKDYVDSIDVLLGVIYSLLTEEECECWEDDYTVTLKIKKLYGGK